MNRFYLPLFALIFAFWALPAHDQGYQCRTSPNGATTAYCSSEAFVTQHFPSSSTAGHAATFADTSGQVLADGGAAAGTVTAVTEGNNTTAAPGAGVVLSPNPCTRACTVSVDASYLRGYIANCTLSTAGGSSTFGIAPCVATDSAATVLLKQPSSYTKTTAAWTVGSSNGALDTGAIANSTWYHVFEIVRTDTGIVDYLISLSATAPTLPTNYTLFRRIGSMKTDGSSQWVKFSQLGDEFLWATPVQDAAAAAIAVTATLFTLSVPIGVQVWTLTTFHFNSTTTSFIAITSPDQADYTPSVSVFDAGATSSVFMDYAMPIRTNISGQIRMRAVAAATTYNNTRGWIDTRGRNN